MALLGEFFRNSPGEAENLLTTQLTEVQGHKGFRQDGKLEFHLFPIKVIDAILPLVMDSPVLFQSLIAVGATSRAAQTGTPRTQASVLRHHGKSLRLLLEACQTLPANNPSAVIIAATWIQRNHLLLGDAPASLKAHQQGINALVKAHGGLHNLSPMAAYMVENLDATYSLSMDTEPSYNIPVPSLKLPDHTLQCGKRFERLSEYPELNPNLLATISDGRLLWDVITLQTRHPAAVSPKQLHYFAYLFARMQRDLIMLNALYHNTHSNDECLVLIQLIFINHLRGFSRLYERLARRFLANLSYEAPATFFLHSEPELLMWMLCICFVAVQAAEDRQRCLHWLRRAQDVRKLGDWDDFRTHSLDGYMWMEEYHGEVFRGLWNVVRSKNTEPAQHQGEERVEIKKEE